MAATLGETRPFAVISGPTFAKEIGGSTKNVLAIGVGIADGLGLGANTRAALITRGLSELMRLAEPLGVRPETLMGLSGLGDLVRPVPTTNRTIVVWV